MKLWLHQTIDTYQYKADQHHQLSCLDEYDEDLIKKPDCDSFQAKSLKMVQQSRDVPIIMNIPYRPSTRSTLGRTIVNQVTQQVSCLEEYEVPDSASFMAAFQYSTINKETIESQQNTKQQVKELMKHLTIDRCDLHKFKLHLQGMVDKVETKTTTTFKQRKPIKPAPLQQTPIQDSPTPLTNTPPLCSNYTTAQQFLPKHTQILNNKQTPESKQTNYRPIRNRSASLQKGYDIASINGLPPYVILNKSGQQFNIRKTSLNRSLNKSMNR